MAPVTGSTPVKSPLPGVILEIKCAVGNTVKKGDVILILEAMKMENVIEATANGKIESIQVNKGDSVLEGDTLVVIG
jgi:biotin carboxyl carrier protein